MKESIKDKVALVGMGCSKFGERFDCSLSDLIIEAAYEAYQDAKIEPDQIQAVYFGNVRANQIAGNPVADTLKLSGIPIFRNSNWCCSGHVALINACLAVASGVYDCVMAIGAEKLKDTGFGGLGIGRGDSAVMENRRTAPGSFGLIATRYFSQYGLTMDEGRRMLAKIAVKNHANGYLTPKAHFHKLITVDEVLNSTVIAYPLTLFDCCGNSDGAAAAIITRADIAKSMRDDPIYVKGYGSAIDSVMPHLRPNFSWTSFPSLVKSSHDAYEMAGIKDPRHEIHVAEVHDCFSVTEMCIYEDFGFSERGKCRDDIENGFFERGGGLPVNVDGGLKCFGHPVGASGIRMTYEVYHQLQGTVDNPERQIKNASRGLSNTFGGPPQFSCVFILGNEKG